jgi:TetR/AcrR family transcriptional regulator, transcriptional repressor for nem operon
MRETDTATRILDVAERLVQTQGFNGFSYADISKELGITKASLHYHFPAKAELGRSLIERYCGAFRAALSEIDSTDRDPRKKLRRYAELYAEVLRRDRMCLCGMLAADYTVLPRPMQDAVRAFFDANETWLSSVLEDGRKRKVLQFRGPPREEARLLLGALEGAMPVARSYGDVSRFSASADRLLQDLSAS